MKKRNFLLAFLSIFLLVACSESDDDQVSTNSQERTITKEEANKILELTSKVAAANIYGIIDKSGEATNKIVNQADLQQKTDDVNTTGCLFWPDFLADNIPISGPIPIPFLGDEAVIIDSNVDYRVFAKCDVFLIPVPAGLNLIGNFNATANLNLFGYDNVLTSSISSENKATFRIGFFGLLGLIGGIPENFEATGQYSSKTIVESIAIDDLKIANAKLILATDSANDCSVTIKPLDPLGSNICLKYEFEVTLLDSDEPAVSFEGYARYSEGQLTFE